MMRDVTMICNVIFSTAALNSDVIKNRNIAELDRRVEIFKTYKADHPDHWSDRIIFSGVEFIGTKYLEVRTKYIVSEFMLGGRNFIKDTKEEAKHILYTLGLMTDPGKVLHCEAACYSETIVNEY